MGCDIHAVIEYVRFDFGYVNAFTQGEVEIPRDYKLFSAIAFGNGGVTDDLPYPPRGLPPDFSSEVRELFFAPAEEVKKLMEVTGDAEEFHAEEIARAWGEWARTEYSSWGNLPGYDWHTPSWLNFNELNKALGHAGLKVEELSHEFRAVLAAMQVLSEGYGAEKVRLVFWFDG